MRITFPRIFVVAVFLLVACTEKKKQLVWSDEFDQPGAPDSTKWGYDLGASNGWGNNELKPTPTAQITAAWKTGS